MPYPIEKLETEYEAAKLEASDAALQAEYSSKLAQDRLAICNNKAIVRDSLGKALTAARLIIRDETHIDRVSTVFAEETKAPDEDT